MIHKTILSEALYLRPIASTKRHIITFIFFLVALATYSKEEIPTDTVANELQRNSIRLDLFGKSMVYGLAYDRIIYHEKYDIHLNIGLSPFLLLNSSSHTANLSAYFATNKGKMNLILGIGSSHYLDTRYSDDPYGRYTSLGFIGGIVGGRYHLNNRWDLQLHYTPAFALYEFDRNSSFFSIIPPSHYWLYLWAGLNVGYNF